MITMTLAEVAEAVGGRLDAADPALLVTGAASVDSRAVEPGGLFVAVVGERTDGHAYAEAAVRDGAAAVLASRATGAPSVLVDDVVDALGRLAAAVLARSGAVVVALTGSAGKTSTKDLLAQVLATAGPTVATAGNYNNEIGVPLTVTRTTASTAYVVLEMGARGVGHLAYLCSFARPVVSAVLNVGSAHLGEFGSRERIALAKGELVESLDAAGTAVLNADDPLVAAMQSRAAGSVLWFGTVPGADVRAEAVSVGPDGRAAFDLVHDGAREPVRLAVVGEHQVPNALAAAGVALVLGLPLPAIATALGEAAPASRWRMEVTEAGGATVLNDAYNANPESMRAALATMASVAGGVGAPGRRRAVAVLGPMYELGDESTTQHLALGEAAVAAGADVVVAVGAEAEEVADGAERAAGDASHTVVVRAAGRDDATAWLRHNVAAGDVVLVKASRGAALERLVEDLVAHLEEDR